MTVPITIKPAQPGGGYAAARDGGWDGKRLGGLAAALTAELLIILLLLTLGWGIASRPTPDETVTTISAQSIAAGAEVEEAEPESQTAPQAATTEPAESVQETINAPHPVQRPTALDRSPRVVLLDEDYNLPPSTRPPARPATPSVSATPSQVYGPPDTGPQNVSRDSELVGIAPNGEPMYAARWYREPTRQELAGYLSTAYAPSSALIVCRTVPDYYVEDCELLRESPKGSQIGRAVLAAAWQFRVRPAVVSGRPQIGSWVRIRIDYTTTVRR